MIRQMTLLSLIGLALACAVLPLQAADVDATLQVAKHVAERASRASIIPRDAFLVKATVRDISMSPDGRWLAYRLDTGQQLELWLREIANGQDANKNANTNHRVMSDSKGTKIIWSGDGARVWLPDDTGLGVFDIETMTGRRIFRFDAARQQIFWGVDSNPPDVALLREKVPVKGEWLYRYLAIDANGKTQVIYETHQALTSVLLDTAGKLRYAAGYDGAAFDTVLWRFSGDEKHELMRCPLPQQCQPIAFDGETIWALAHNGENLMSLQKWNGVTDKWQVLHTDPRGISDAGSLLMQPDGKNWFAIAYRPDRIEWYGRTAKAKAALTTLQQKLPGANLYIDMSNDGKRWLVQAKKANWFYDQYFLYELPGKTLSPLFTEERHSAIVAEQLAEAIPMQWRGKDGMALHGYVYLPKGIPLATAPIIALIHGGPYSQSLGEMSPFTQLLVNRGYIVFKPNFRASTGYGVNYATAAGGNFGKHGVLDDIITGLDYLIANGIGDVKQQAIAGHSFGGYATLLAVTHYPDRFAFAVPSAAPVDIAWSLADNTVEGGSALPADGPPAEILFHGYGIPYGEEEWHQRMHRDSPLAHADELRTPVYLWAGAKDDRVAVESLVHYVVEANPEYQPALLIDPDSGHNPQEQLNFEAVMWLIENAANEHFGGGITPPSPALQAFLKKNLKKGAVLR